MSENTIYNIRYVERRLEKGSAFAEPWFVDLGTTTTLEVAFDLIVNISRSNIDATFWTLHPDISKFDDERLCSYVRGAHWITSNFMDGTELGGYVIIPRRLNELVHPS